MKRRLATGTLCLLFVICLFSGCSGGQKKIILEDLFSGVRLQAKVTCDSVQDKKGPLVSFRSSNDMETVVEELKAAGGVTAESYGDMMTRLIVEQEGTRGEFYICKMDATSLYCIKAPTIVVRPNNNPDADTHYVFPVYLLHYSSPMNVGVVPEGKAMRLNGTKEDVLAFYEENAYYQMESIENGIRLTSFLLEEEEPALYSSASALTITFGTDGEFTTVTLTH